MADQGYAVKRSRNQYDPLQGKRPLLSHIDIELTERCNNACLHCYINLPANDRQAQARELTTDEWKNILRQAADLGALRARFTGGEPLLREDFAELYLFARKLGMKVLIFTNARLITPELADLLARVPPLDKIEITVYGMHSETYDAVSCIPGSYAQFRRGVDNLWQRKIPFVVKAALLPQNKAEMAEFEAWAATIPWMDKRPGYAMFLDLRARRDSEAKNRLISRLRVSPEEGLAVLVRDPDMYCRNMVGFCSKFMGSPGDLLFGCGTGDGGCIDAYGKYQVCMSVRHPDFVYDLNNGSLRHALTEAFPRILEMRATDTAYLARCARCFLKGLCEQCPGKSWMEHGTLDTPVEYLCQVAHAQARYLGLLADGEHAWDVEDGKERVKKMAEDLRTI